MEQVIWDKIYFWDSVNDCDPQKQFGHILHILCMEGSMSFVFHNVRYNIAKGDYVILPNGSLACSFSESSDFDAIIMSLSESFVTSMALRSNYGIIGHLSLLQNPVMRLSENDFRKCRTDMLRLRERLNDREHLFQEEMLGHLLLAHILDLYDIHARGRKPEPIPEGRYPFCGNSLKCFIKENMSGIVICLIMRRIFALRLITFRKYAKRWAASLRLTG